MRRGKWGGGGALIQAHDDNVIQLHTCCTIFATSCSALLISTAPAAVVVLSAVTSSIGIFSSNSSSSATASALAICAACTSCSSSAAANADSSSPGAAFRPTICDAVAAPTSDAVGADATTVSLSVSIGSALVAALSAGRATTAGDAIAAAVPSAAGASTTNRSWIVELLKYSVVKLPPSMAKLPNRRFWLAFFSMFSSMVFSLTSR